LETRLRYLINQNAKVAPVKEKPVEKKEIPQMRAMPDPGKETVK